MVGDATTDTMYLVKIVSIWLLMLFVAVTVGGLRVALLEPRLGPQGAHVIGTLAVMAIFAGIIWSSTRWISPALDGRQLMRTGIIWLLATVAFEFGFGHFVMGHPWSELLADYNLLAGRLWSLVLLAIVFLPAVFGAIQSRSGPDTAWLIERGDEK